MRKSIQDIRLTHSQDSLILKDGSGKVVINFHEIDAELIIFDLNGVLVANVSSIFPSAILEGFAPNREPDSVIRFKGTDWISEVAAMGVNTDNPHTRNEIARRMDENSAKKQKAVLHAWVTDTVPALARANKKLAICTNNSMFGVLSAMDGLFGYFSLVKTCEDVSRLKPFPDGILAICRELEISPAKTLMMGDSQEDIDASRAAGVRCLIIKGEEII